MDALRCDLAVLYLNSGNLSRGREPQS